MEMGQNALTEYLNAIALLIVEPDFEGVRWVTELSEPVWNGANAPEAWADGYQPLVQLLYDLGFLGIGDGRGISYSYDRPGFADVAGNLTEATRYSVHPSFQPTLGVRAPSSSPSRKS
ncbi:MAG TPA: hypothetical protein VGU02_01045 [Gaiellaceae bacterium]|nr:hypothetical protein [Gaiellaceae bacterium]